MREVMVVVNPISGSVFRHRLLGVLLRYLRAHQRTQGYNLTVRLTRHAGHVAEILSRRVLKEYDVVLSVGGDGTLNECARALVGRAIPLGIVAMGSGNGLARHLGLPLRPLDALSRLQSAVPLQMDTGRIAEHLFAGVAGVGLDGDVGWQYDKLPARGPVSYVQAVAQVYFTYRPRTYTICVDGVSRTVRALMLTFCNGSQFGNNAMIAPGASVTDGYLDLVIVHPFPKVDISYLAFMLFNGQIDRSRYVECIRFRHLEVQTDGPVRGHCDGESRLFPAHFEVKVVPGDLRVLVPKEREGRV